VTVGALLAGGSVELATVIQEIPGLQHASRAFVAGVVFVIMKIGLDSFCEWCKERRSRKDDELAGRTQNRG